MRMQSIQGLVCPFIPFFFFFFLRSIFDTDIDKGRTLSSLALDFVHQGIWQIEHNSSQTGHGPHYGMPEEHLTTLHTVKTLLPILLDELPILTHYGVPVLCHPDFHPGNIFVARDDPTHVTGIVDWQFAGILPRFTVQAPGTSRDPVSSPADTSPNSSTEEARQEVKCFEAAMLESRTGLPEPDITVRNLFTLPPDTHRDGILPLRDCLVKIFQNWTTRLGIRRECPFHFSAAEITAHERKLVEYQDWLRLRQYTLEILQANDTGWVAQGVDFERAKARYDQLYGQFLAAKTQHMSKAEAEKLWFFSS